MHDIDNVHEIHEIYQCKPIKQQDRDLLCLTFVFLARFFSPITSKWSLQPLYDLVYKYPLKLQCEDARFQLNISDHQVNLHVVPNQTFQQLQNRIPD